MTEKYLDLKSGKVIKIEIFEGKNQKEIREIENEIISKERYNEIIEKCPEIDEIIPAYISNKNLNVKMSNDWGKWNADGVEKYFINNEIYIQFSDYYKRKNIVKKAEFFISEVEEVEFNGETQENEFALYARLEIDGKIVKLNEYLAKNRLNLLDILVKEKDVENEYY